MVAARVSSCLFSPEMEENQVWPGGEGEGTGGREMKDSILGMGGAGVTETVWVRPQKPQRDHGGVAPKCRHPSE
jgi:hypothetical protein